jgi:hypothetical protein
MKVTRDRAIEAGPDERAPVAPTAPALRTLPPGADRGALARAALGLQRTRGNRSVARAVLARKPGPPEYLVNPQFCGVTVSPGVNPTMAERLAAVEKHLRDVVWPAMPAEAKIDRKTGAPTTEVNKWLGIGSVGGWKQGSWHSSGSAVDVDATWGPYIATRNFDAAGNPAYGGEDAGKHLKEERARALAVNDRAMQWLGYERADLSTRKGTKESIGDAYDRFRLASDALSIWMMYAIPENRPPMISRKPIADVHDPAKVSDDDLLAKIPESERLPKDIGVQLVREDMERDWWKQIHPKGWPQTPEQVYFQVLRDYEMVRVPMVSGTPEARPGITRNPVHGFIHHRKALVEAMVEVGKLRWGACDFGAGVDGDTHHFDLNSHAGYEPSTKE